MMGRRVNAPLGTVARADLPRLLGLPGLVGLACFINLVLASPALAHKPSDSYLRITGGAEAQQTLSLEWDIALKDLDFLVGLDPNHDSKITWGEVKANRQAIVARALSRLSISADGQTCDLRVTDLLVNDHSDGTYATLVIDTDCPGDARVLDIEYSLLFQADPTHRGLVIYQNDQTSSTHVLSSGDSSLELHTGEPGLWQAFLEYIRTGMWHIWTGFGHILFLISLLLPAVMVKRDNTWQPVDNFRPACLTVIKLATMFTIAHSITLWLAVSGWVDVPSRLVESGIALSILVTAINNLVPKYHISDRYFAFGFGLIHGIGFASALGGLGVGTWALVRALLGFNSGVELGQLLIILLAFPLMFMLRRTRFYDWVILRAGSVLIALVAAVWLIERALNMKIIGF